MITQENELPIETNGTSESSMESKKIQNFQRPCTEKLNTFSSSQRIIVNSKDFNLLPSVESFFTHPIDNCRSRLIDNTKSG